MNRGLSEATVEEAGLEWFRDLGYETRFGTEIAPDGPNPERANFGEVVLLGRLRAALARLNPQLPEAGPRGGSGQAPARGDAVPGRGKPAPSPHDRGRPGRGGRPRRRHHCGRQGLAGRFRRPGQQRLARGQPVHGDREPEQPAPGRGGVRERPAARGDRAQEPGRRGRDASRRLQPAPDLQAGDPLAVPHQRRARHLGRAGGAARLADRQYRVVPALAHGGRDHDLAQGLARVGNPDRGRVREAAIPGLHPGVHSLRERWRRVGQEDRRLSPVPRRAPCGRLHHRRHGAGGRPARRRDLAHPGLGQEPADGVLRRPDRRASGDGEPDPGADHGPQRPATGSCSGPSRAVPT